MSYLMSIFLGLVQGVTEFLPISSSGHLSILQNIFGMDAVGESSMFFDVLLHFGTLAAVIAVYRRDVVDMIHEFVGFFRDLRHKDPEKYEEVVDESAIRQPRSARRLLFLIIIGTLPLVFVLPIKDYVERLYSNTFFIGFALIITGILLYISDKIVVGKKNEKSATVKSVVITGFAQALAVIPGLSRSGTTITVGLLCGFDRKFSLKFSFLLSIPAVLGANLVSLADAIKEGIDWALVPVYLVGMLAAAVAGYGAIRLLKLIMDRGRLGGFAYYCWAVGLITIVLSFFI